MMKRKLFCAVCFALVMMPMALLGQTYNSLWKQVKEAEEKDLPQTQQKVLQQIIEKAEKEKSYGHLLKAGLMNARVQAMVSPDSLLPAVKQLQQRAETVKDQPLQAVYDAVLGLVYQNNHNLDEHWERISADYFRKAMAHPDQLAAVKTDPYQPFVVKGTDSRIYNDDLLSLIGSETHQYQQMYDYYMGTDNRRAQLMSCLSLLRNDAPDGSFQLNNCAYIHRLDSLANAYADLPECGEVAISRYMFMNEQTDATAEQKVAYIDEALQRWGSWHRMNDLRNARNTLTSIKFNAILANRVWIPEREQELRLEGLRGISQLIIRFYQVKAKGDIQLDLSSDTYYKELKPLLKLLPELTITRTYSGKKDFELYADTLQMAALPVGVYLMEVESQPKTKVSRCLFFISNVRVLAQGLPQNQVRYIAVDATTGKPLPGAQLKLMRRHGIGKDKVYATLTTDNKGEAVYQVVNQDYPNTIYATYKDDNACPEINAYGHFNYYANNRSVEHTAIYTDRAIYRPGQTVHVAAICYETRNGFEQEVMGHKQVKLVLRDANYKTVTEQQLTTDELGTVSTDFTLPTSALTGHFSIEVDGTSQSFRVEEYKRPTFQVEFPKVEQNYKNGDTLMVKATARTYSGVPVQGAHVKYTVERRIAFWWVSYYRYWDGGYIGNTQQREEIFSGEATTDDNGQFEVSMPMVLPQSLHPQFYHFVVVADVTDQGGETHQGQLSLPLGNREEVLVADLPEQVLLEQMPKLKLHLLNAAGNDVNAELRYQIDGGKWISVSSNTAIDLPKLKSGKHQLKAEYNDLKLEQTFVVFSLDDKRPAFETNNWFYVSDAQFPNNGKPVTLQVGASGYTHIVYTIVSGDEMIEQGSVDCSNELINRKLTYKSEYGDGLTLSYAWIRNGQTYTHNCTIQRPLPDKELKMKWETFRDRLTPGQQEEWTLSITPNEQTSNSNLPSPIQLMATLYDQSLDQLMAHNWSLQPRLWLPMANLNWNYGTWGSVGCDGYLHKDYLEVKGLAFSRFDSECFPNPWLTRSRRTRSLGALVLREVAVSAQKAKAYDVAEVEYASNESNAALQGRIAGLDIADNSNNSKNWKRQTGSGLPTDEVPEVQIRENLQETAFFYPQLLADSTGRVSIKFTLPESLTTWRFMGIAHTKDMMHGYLEGMAVAQKDVMIQPNVPRFLRVGDSGTISARIFNTTESEKNGIVRLQLIEPESNQIVWTEQTTCLLRPNGTFAVSFPVDASKLASYSLLICKMSVSGDTFSDGEQQYLPILPNREQVTVTVPFTQNEPGTKTIDLTKLVPSESTSSKLTIEYTNNPAWFMVQALPAIGIPSDKSAISQAASLYANSIAQFILHQNPQVKQVFESWKREAAQGGQSASSLRSQLEKNEELKELLLNETPWVMDADRETEQKQRLADFFDHNLMQNRLQLAADQLKQLQRADGSWSWWEGMPGSFYMTVEVSEILVRLNHMTGGQSLVQSQLDKAFSYMNQEILNLVSEMKKQEKKGIKQTFPSFKALQYLYLCTLDGRKQSADVQQAQTYLKNLLKKDVKKQTIYEKAMTAIILHSSLYLKSLKEYTVYKEEMGRYYDTPRASYSWRDYRIPTQVAAIEALQQLTPADTQTIDEMRRWLLQQKRTQAWDTPINSVNAVYAFLNDNGQELQSQPSTTLKVDGHELQTSQATAGIGYVKTTMEGNGKQQFTAEKTSTGTSWGAVYAQFMQPTSEIAAQQSGITVKRELLGYDGTSPLKVGARIKVRITLKADRDYDFVQVVDKRAACMEPVEPLSGYRNGAYVAPKDCATNYYYHMLPKGTTVIETTYYVDRAGTYETGTCTAGCAYAPEFRGTAPSLTLTVIE